ncbi:MAG: glycosyltransferase family 39 protein [Anaerolineales bacterium]|nr:glycosyltransferase family 39 protein [Anaerolineales bacterium]
MSFERRELGLLGLLLLARLAVGLTYSFLNPPWESYDETGHFQYARYLAKHRVLTLRSGDPEAEVIWSKFQPPLYYIVVMPILLVFDFGPAFEYPARNPYLATGEGGVNYALPSNKPSPLAVTQVTALLVMRSVGVLISTASVVFVYLTARRLWRRHKAPAWAATCLYAFWPQFLFMGSMATNDLLMVALAAPLTYLTAEACRRGLRRREWALAGLLILSGLLTKLNGVAFLPPLLVAALLSLTPQPRRRWALTAGVLLVSLLVGAGLLSSMEFVTGQLFRPETFWRFIRNLRNEVGPAPVALNWSVAEYGFRSYLALYGWGNLEGFPWLYPPALVGLALAALGWLRLGLRSTGVEPSRRVILGLGLWPLSLIGLALALAIAQSDPYLLVGRYLLPSLPALAMLLVLGWQALLPTCIWRYFWPALSLGVILIGWLTPVTIIAPAYAQPQPISASELSRVERGLSARFGGLLEMTGHLPIAPARAGERLEATLCWRALAPTSTNYPLSVEIRGPDGQGYGRRQTYPGDGNYPTSLWEPGREFCDPLGMTIRGDFPAPAVGALTVRFLEGVNGAPLPATTLDGAPLADVLIPIVVRAAAAPSPPTYRLGYRFGEAIMLNGYDLAYGADGRSLRVTLHWEARAPVAASYKVFAHLRTAVPGHYTQSDQLPRRNAYPTNVWAVGERIADEHDLPLPEGATWEDVTLYVGLYRPEDGARLPVMDERGQPVPNNEITLPLR